jgi:phage FluMu protein Com
MENHIDCTSCKIIKLNEPVQYKQLKCALCKIVDKTKTSIDHPHDLLKCINEISIIASSVLIVELLQNYKDK